MKREKAVGKSMLKKRHLLMAGTAATALWCQLRNKKYPLAEGYPLINKFIVPEEDWNFCGITGCEPCSPWKRGITFNTIT